MYPFVDEHNVRILAAIHRLEVGSLFAFKDLFGDDWEGFGDGNQRQGFGTQFSKAFAAGRFPQIDRDGIYINGRDVRYRKL